MTEEERIKREERKQKILSKSKNRMELVSGDIVKYFFSINFYKFL